jgi:hypothetical protein
MSPLAQQAWRQAHQVRETAGERADTGIAHLEANLGHTEGSRHKQPPGRLKAQRSEKFARRNANQATKDAMEMRGTHTGHRSQIFKGQDFLQMSMHDLDRAFNGLPLSGKSHVTRCVFTENGWCGLHHVLPSSTERSPPVYSF